MPKYEEEKKIHLREYPPSGSKAKDVKEQEKKRREKDRKLVITMASYGLQRHLGWRTKSCLGQNKFDQQQIQLKSAKQPNSMAVTLKQLKLVL